MLDEKTSVVSKACYLIEFILFMLAIKRFHICKIAIIFFSRKNRNSFLIDYRRLAIEYTKRIAPDLQEILEHTMQTSLSKFQTELAVHSFRLDELKQRVNRLEEENASLTDMVSKINVERICVDNNMEDLENRSHHNNWRLIVLPESVNMAELHRLYEVQLPKALGPDRSCRVERAHRIGLDTNARGDDATSKARQPRQVIMGYLDFNDKRASYVHTAK